MGRTFKDSKQGKIEQTKAPKGTPNIVIVLLDDVGFGAAGTFGGPVASPVMDRLAKEGLRSNAFHTTALCSPTRAALLTGRNHYSVGTGQFTEGATGFDGYTSIIPKRRHGGGDPAAEWLQYVSLGQVAQHPGLGDQHGGAFDRWPISWFS